jgi:integrase
MVRRFAAWCATSDPRTEVPPDGLLRHRYRRTQPHIYSDEEINRIVDAAGGLPSSTGLCARTYSTIFGLLAVTGMRVSEVVALDRVDVDLEHGIVTVRRSKFGSSRFVPVHPSTVEALGAYAAHRDRLLAAPFTASFFVSERADHGLHGSLHLRRRIAPDRASGERRGPSSWSRSADS